MMAGLALRSPVRRGAIVTLVGALALAASPAQAWDGIHSGTITKIELASGATNYALRITLAGQPLCGDGSTNWAYINKDEPNYEAMSALIMTAWTTGRPILVHLTRTNSVVCKIGHLSTA